MDSRVIKVIIFLFSNFLYLYNRVVSALLRRYIYSITNIGSFCNISSDIRIKNPENLTIGNYVNIGPLVTIGCMNKVTIEDEVTISQGVLIETGSLRLNPRRHVSKEIIIKERVWIGANAIILGGVELGQNCVIGAGEVVRESIPAHSILINNKIKKIGKLNVE